MGETEGRQEKDEAGRAGGSAAGGLPGSAESDGVVVPSIEPAPITGSPAEGERTESVRSKPLWREYGEAIVIAIILALFIRTFIVQRSEEHTSELQSPCNLVCRLLLEKKKKNIYATVICVCDS